jgi:glycosyltransferase involved in cell wall biosynthesis
LGLYRQSQIRNPKSKIFLDIDDWEQAWAPINSYPWPVARFLAWQEEWGIRHADGITAASRWLEARANQYAPQTPVLYLPNGVDLKIADCRFGCPLGVADYETRPSPTAARLLFFTRFMEVEPDWLAEFWHSLQPQLPEARLIVAGAALQPGREQVFQERMRHLNPASADQVEWMGYVSQAQQATLFSSVDCAIFPAMNVPLLQAKCSVKLATTLLHGVPVVASAVGEQAAYGAEGAACLVDPAATPAEFAGAVVSLLRQPECQQAMVDAARRRLAATYDWAALGAKLENFYRRWVQ